MSAIKKLGIGAGVLVVAVGGIAAGGLAWGKSELANRFAKTYQVHSADFPIPFPLTAAEIEALRAERTAAAPAAEAADAGTEDVLAGVDLMAIARERASARGKHLLEARYVCIECHGKDLSGGVMIDSPPMGVLKGKNLTAGKGGVVANYKAADWDRMVRHGVKPNGTATPMPSEDFGRMSDRELSDLVTYIRNAPPVDNTVPELTWGPVGTMLVATGAIPLSADSLPHQTPHAVEPPAEDSPDFGKHLVMICTGCHNPQLSGGPIMGGDPAWAPARNLTPHTDGLAGWTYEDFVKALREGKRKNGEDLKAPMTNMMVYAKNITETEMKAIWGYLQSLPPLPTPK